MYPRKKWIPSSDPIRSGSSQSSPEAPRLNVTSSMIRNGITLPVISVQKPDDDVKGYAKGGLVKKGKRK